MKTEVYTACSKINDANVNDRKFCIAADELTNLMGRSRLRRYRAFTRHRGALLDAPQIIPLFPWVYLAVSFHVVVTTL